MAERSAFRNYSTIEEGRLQVELDAETRRLLGVWLETERRSGRFPLGKRNFIRVGLTDNTQCSYMDILAPWLAEWCKRPYKVTRVRLERGKDNRERLDVRAKQPDHVEICRLFAARLLQHQASASDVLRALITTMVKDRRAELMLAEKESHAEAVRKMKAQRQRKWRNKRDASLSEVIDDFLEAVGKPRYTPRSPEQMREDEKALIRLTEWSRDTYIAVARRIKTTQKLTDTQDTARKRLLAEKFIIPLGFALPEVKVPAKRGHGSTPFG